MDILIFGGDQRQISAADRLIQLGHAVSLSAFDKTVEESIDSIKNGIGGKWNAIVFPLPFTRDKVTVNCPLSSDTHEIQKILSYILPGTVVLAGMIDRYVRHAFEDRRLDVTDYYDSDEIQIKNAVPTAEAAIGIFIERLPITLMGSRCSVIGYGRVARALAQRLKALGATVTVAARSMSALALAECEGMMPIILDTYSKGKNCDDCIFNTVPSNIFAASFAENVKKDALFVDLASLPGGVTPECKEALGSRYIFTSSLPGKTAPVTSGRIIADTIDSILLSKKRGIQ